MNNKLYFHLSETPVKKPPARPVSAKIGHQPRADTNPRVPVGGNPGQWGKSAPNHQPHPPMEPPSGRATMKIGQTVKIEQQPPSQVGKQDLKS